MRSVAILAITKSGISTGLKLLGAHPEWELHAPKKFEEASQGRRDCIRWYADPTSAKIANLFMSREGLICIFSLGATIRLVAPHMKSKKTDPAVVVIDEAADFAISVLSGHIGGANEMTRDVAGLLGAQAVITTAADVKGTISVDMVGRDLGWVIEDDADVTATSAHMVNEDKIAIYQDAGEPDWHGGRPLPANVITCDTLQDMQESHASAHLVISDKIHHHNNNNNNNSSSSDAKTVVYRPPTLTVGVGLHYNTTSDTILGGIRDVFGKYGLATKSIRSIASIKKPTDVPGLQEAADALGVQLVLYDRDRLADVTVPNPSQTVQRFEGTPSVSEAACLMASRAGSSSGPNPEDHSLVVEKQKFPPDLTIAVARHQQYSRHCRGKTQ